MNKKILAIIKSNTGRFLLLRTNPKWLKVDIWYVVTGGVKDRESYENAVRREVHEETGLKILKVIPIKYYYDYEWPIGSRQMHHEKAFLVIVEESKPKLSGEHLEFKWLDKKEFVKQIDWYNEKEDLKKIIKIN